MGRSSLIWWHSCLSLIRQIKPSKVSPHRKEKIKGVAIRANKSNLFGSSLHILHSLHQSVLEYYRQICNNWLMDKQIHLAQWNWTITVNEEKKKIRTQNQLRCKTNQQTNNLVNSTFPYYTWCKTVVVLTGQVWLYSKILMNVQFLEEEKKNKSFMINK